MDFSQNARDMSSSPENFEQTLHRLGAEASRSLTIHPDYRELAGYCEDTLEVGVEEAIREHLSHCPACARVVLDLLQPPAAVETKASERDGKWQEVLALAADIDAAKAPTPVKVEAQFPDSPSEAQDDLPAPGPYKVVSDWALIAAALALVALGGWWFLNRAPVSPGFAGEPQVLAYLGDIPGDHRIKASALSRGESEIVLHRSDQPSDWELKTANESTYDHYTVHLSNSERAVWEASLEPVSDSLQFFGLRLTPKFFSVGDYSIKIMGWHDEEAHELGVFLLRIRE